MTTMTRRKNLTLLQVDHVATKREKVVLVSLIQVLPFQTLFATHLGTELLATTSNKFQRYSSAEGSSEDDGDYLQNKKHKSKKRKPARTVKDFELPRFSSRNGKALPNYDENAMFTDLSDEDEEEGYEMGAVYEDPGSSPSLLSFLDPFADRGSNGT